MAINRFPLILLFLILPLAGCDSSTGPATVVDAVLSMIPASGNTSTDFTFNASGSSSTAKTPSLEYRWDWEDDGSWDESWSATSSESHSFDDPGAYTVRVEVRDGTATDQATVSLTIDPEIFPVLEVSPEEGTILTDFEFDAGASTSSSSGIGSLEYRWDLEDDGTFDTDWSSQSTLTTRFPAGVGYPRVRVEVRDGGGVSDASAQVTMIGNHGAVVDSLVLDPLIRASGMTYDGEHFWISQWGPDETLVQVSSETGAILKSFPAHSNWTGGLAWDGTHLWQTSFTTGQAIIEIDPDDGTVLSDFPVIYSKSRSGLCWDGTGFFFGSRYSETKGGDDKIHKYDATGNELAVLDVPAGTTVPHGLTCDRETLWFVDQAVPTIFQLDPLTGAVLNSFDRVGYATMTIAEGYIWTFRHPGDYAVLYKIVP